MTTRGGGFHHESRRLVEPTATLRRQAGMNIPITPELALTKLLPTDSQAVCRHLADPCIAATTTGVPWPYIPEDFAATMARAEAAELEHGHPTYLAIRRADGLLIGVISFTNFFMGIGAEIGYWLARENWGRGIMTASVGAACRFAFDRMELAVIFASVFEGNVASERVLLKNEFSFEGAVRLSKDDQEVPGRMFVRLADSDEPPF